MNKFTKPGELARVLGITTDALRKQRIRGSSPYEYEVIEGRVLYLTASLPPSVSDNIVKTTTKKTREKHEDIRSPRYWNSIGKVNDRKIRNRARSIEAEVKDRLAIEQEKRLTKHEHKSKKVYAYFCDPFTSANYWNSIKDYERSKQKKKVVPFY